MLWIMADDKSTSTHLGLANTFYFCKAVPNIDRGETRLCVDQLSNRNGKTGSVV